MVTTLSNLRVRAGDYASDCSDALSTMRQFKFGTGNTLVFKDEREASIIGKFNDWSFNQLCFKMNVPAGWIGKPQNCPEELKVDILNQLSEKYRDDADFMVRMKGNVIRAMLSSQYSRFDNVEYLDLIAEAVQQMGIEPQIHRDILGDEMKAYVVFPQITFAQDPKADGRDDGGLHPALYVSNSERGGGSARVVGAVFRSICTNGVIFGWKENSSLKVMHRFHSRGMIAALVADGIAEGMRMSEEATKRFIASQDEKISKPNLNAMVLEMASRYGLTVDARDNWLASITSEATQNGRKDDVRYFDVINAATYVAQT